MADPRRYPLAYKFISGANRTATELRAEDLGGCDAVILHSILFPSDGSRSEQIVSMDGRTGRDLSQDELFKSWAMMAHALAERLPPGGRRDLCAGVHEAIRAELQRLAGLASAVAWEADAPDHWRWQRNGRTQATCWQRARDGRWIWELWVGDDPDTPSHTGDAESKEAAGVAVVAELQRLAGEATR